MKISRIVSLLLVVVLLVSFWGVDVSADVVAQGTCGANLKWEISDRTLTISGTGAMDDSPHYDVGGPWYDYLASFDHVIVKEGVTYIGARAFANYPIQSVILPDSVTKIGTRAFYCCMDMTKLVLGKGLKTIGEEAFSTCSSLTAVAFPDSVRTIENNAFADCWALQQVAVPDGVTVLTWSVFQNTAIKKIYIPASVTKIEASVFAYDEALTDVYFGGTEAQWNAITVDNNENRNDYLLNATVHFNHQHDWDSGKVAVSATCAQNGSKVYSCSVCKGTRSTSISKTKSHTWDNGSVTAAATCSKEGNQTYTCSVCNETKVESLPKLDQHTWDKGKTNPDTTKTFTCTVCNTTKTEGTPTETPPQETLPATTAPEETTSPTNESVNSTPTQPTEQTESAMPTETAAPEQNKNPISWIVILLLVCFVLAAGGIGIWFWLRKRK